MKNQPFSRRFSWALQGIWVTWQREASFRTHVVCLGLLIVLVLLVQPSLIWCAFLLSSSSAVLVTELLNTALEEAMDLIHPELHPVVKRIKDGAAGAVLIASGSAVGIFCLFLWAHFHKSFFLAQYETP